MFDRPGKNGHKSGEKSGNFEILCISCVSGNPETYKISNVDNHMIILKKSSGY